MFTLFDADTSLAGFRLHKLEVYNWGTFHEKIYSLAPRGRTSLLTGANGSGKTTLVDALLTLLVPPNLRFYNQSSGAERKKERDEASYVLGYYGRTSDDELLASRIEKLRTKEDYSIILAAFFHQGLQQYLTLAQVRWFSATEFKRLFLIAPKELSIQPHLATFEPGPNWKKSFKNLCHGEIFDSFTEYSQAFMKYFGMRSVKALGLLNQIVGIKVLGNLDEFIRTHMLEETNIEEEFRKMRENYDNLLSAHKAIAKARRQLEYLQPIVEKHEAWQRVKSELNRIDAVLNVLPLFFAHEKAGLLKSAIAEMRNQLARRADKIAEIESTISQLLQERIALESAIRSDETGIRVQQLEERRQALEKSKAQKQKSLERYNRLAEKLEFDVNPSEAAFFKTQDEAHSLQQKIERQLPQLQEQWADLREEAKGLESEIARDQQELGSLRQRKNQIPLEYIRLREAILTAVGTSEREIPFAGELVRVSEGEEEWKSAIERLLRTFGLSLLVPERCYEEVTRFVRRQRMQQHVFYLKVQQHREKLQFVSPVENGLLSKIEIKPDCAYADWLDAFLLEQYNFACAKSLDTFKRHAKAVTPEGLLKDEAHHEKDDRPSALNPENYILGWDNQEKIKQLALKIERAKETLGAKKQHLEQLLLRQESLMRKKEWLVELLTFSVFTDLNWQEDAKAIQACLAEKKTLMASSNRLKELKQRLEECEAGAKRAQTEHDQHISERAQLEARLVEHEQKLVLCEQQLSGAIAFAPEAAAESLAAYFDEPKPRLALDNIDEVGQRLERKLFALRSGLEKDERALENALTRAMALFKNPPKEVLDEFPAWTAETLNLAPEVNYTGEYIAVYERILREDLPRQQERFKRYLNENVINDLASFKTSLEKQEEAIKESIAELNTSLQRIDFNSGPQTYIKLMYKPARAVAIKEFRQMLREWQPDIAQYELTKDDSILERSFKKIQALIDRLTDDELWRKRVTDVRHWLEFSATEFYRADDQQCKYYESSGSLSGGEAAQLTYTILGAALAYQFGINAREGRTKSFRFFMVDEAFSKLDSDKSKYLMNLCEQLALQLLVVTPLSNIHIVEPYISACHYVENKNRRTSSVYDLTIEEYFEMKEQFQTAELSDDLAA